MPWIALPSKDVPAVISSELEGNAACKLFKNVKWSAYGWYAVNHEKAGRAAAAAVLALESTTLVSKPVSQLGQSP
jgi:hypothetical protein